MNPLADNVVLQILLCSPVMEWKNVTLINSQWHDIFSSELFSEQYLVNLMKLSHNDISKLKHTLKCINNVNDKPLEPLRKKKKEENRTFWRLLTQHLGAIHFLDWKWKSLEKKVMKRDISIYYRMVELKVMDDLKKKYEDRLSDELVIKEGGRVLGSVNRIGELVQLQDVHCKPYLFNSYSDGDVTALYEEQASCESILVDFVISLKFGYVLHVKSIYQNFDIKYRERAIQEVYILDKQVFCMKFSDKKVTASVNVEYLRFLQEHVFHVKDGDCLDHFTHDLNVTTAVDPKKLFNTLVIKFFNPNFLSKYHYFEDCLLSDQEKTFDIDGLYYEALFGKD